MLDHCSLMVSRKKKNETLKFFTRKGNDWHITHVKGTINRVEEAKERKSVRKDFIYEFLLCQQAKCGNSCHTNTYNRPNHSNVRYSFIFSFCKWIICRCRRIRVHFFFQIGSLQLYASIIMYTIVSLTSVHKV